MTTLDVHNLDFSYNEKVLFQGANYTFIGGRKYGVLGLNGTGKTTLFNILKANIRVPSEMVLFNKEPIGKNDSYFLETTNFYYSNITGREYLNIFDETKALLHFDKVNSVFELPLDEVIEKYSTGMKKKLAIMTMLMFDRPIYFLDEPYNGLDIEANKILDIIIDKLASMGKLVLISSHIINPLLNLCDEILLLKDQKFIKFEKVDFEKVEVALFGDMEDRVKGVLL